MLQIKCKKCKTWNDGGDFCLKCNAVVSMEEEEHLEIVIKKEIKRNKPKDKIELFIEKYEHHNNLILRGIFYIFYPVYLLFSAIGLFLAWLILMSQA